MFKKLFFVSAIFAVIILTSCTQENKVIVNCPCCDSALEENGLTKEINELVPDSILTKMKEIGMPIYTGDNPPNIEFSYKISPLKLVDSNVPDDSIGNDFANMLIKFYNQNNDKLTIQCFYKQANQIGLGVGGYVVGNNNKFTVFLDCESTDTLGNKIITTEVFSGEATYSGIKNLYTALFMVDNKGNDSIYIKNGQGRVGFDSDGMSEKILDIQAGGIVNSNPNNDDNKFLILSSDISKTTKINKFRTISNR